MAIAAIEDAILAKVNATLPNLLRATDTLPGPWSLDLLRRLLQKAPGVYASFLGGKQSDEATIVMLDAKFDVYLVSKEADETTRRRGNPRVIGCYDMIERLSPVLHGMEIGGIGSLDLVDVKNLFAGSMLDLGGTVYALTLRLPRLVLEAPLDPVGLGDFITFRAESDIDGDGIADFVNEFSLPQGP